MFVFNFVIYMIYWKTKLYFASEILLNFTLKWDDIKTVITGLLKANIIITCLIKKGFSLMKNLSMVIELNS